MHFVRFEKFDQSYWNAVRVFGPPLFLHRNFDLRSQREISEHDVIVFAQGEADQPLSHFNGDDDFYEH